MQCAWVEIWLVDCLKQCIYQNGSVKILEIRCEAKKYQFQWDRNVYRYTLSIKYFLVHFPKKTITAMCVCEINSCRSALLGVARNDER